MENNYKVEITFADGTIITEDVKALNELEALDIVHAKHKDIVDIKVV